MVERGMHCAHEEFARLKDARFPENITALTHVIEQMDELLMSPEEALMKAAASGKMEWLEHLLHKFGSDPLSAVASAAGSGRLNVVTFLLSKNRTPRHRDEDDDSDSSDSKEDDEDERNGPNDNEEGGGGNEHRGEDRDRQSDEEQEPELAEDDDATREEEHYEYNAKTRTAWKEALVSAARGGHPTVVEFFLPSIVAAGLNDRDAVDRSVWKALDAAAANGHLEVVRFVVGHATMWGYADLYEAIGEYDALYLAILGGHDSVAKFLLVLEQPQIHWDLKGAFKLAVNLGQQDIVEWVCAVYQDVDTDKDLLAEMIRDDQVNAVEYLVQVFPQSVNQAFRTPDLKVIKFLYENCNVSTEIITDAFESAARCGSKDGVYHFPSDDQLEIAKLLSKDKCLPSGVLQKTFMSAATNQHSEMTQSLRDDPRIPTEMVAHFFQDAATKGDIDMTMALCSERRVSPQQLSNALKAAADGGFVEIVQILIANPAIPETAKQEAVVSAARSNKGEVVRRICDEGEWTTEVLRRALKATTQEELKEFLNSKLGQVKRSDDAVNSTDG